MKKFVAAFIALIMMITVSAFAHGPLWVDLYLEDMIISVPEDILGELPEYYGPDEPFAVFYENYNPNKLLNNNLTFSYNYDSFDISDATPYEWATYFLEGSKQALISSGIYCTYSTVIDASVGMQDGKEVLYTMYMNSVDFSALGYNEAFDIYTLMMTIPYPETGRTYTVALGTDNIAASETLMLITETIRWQ